MYGLIHQFVFVFKITLSSLLLTESSSGMYTLFNVKRSYVIFFDKCFGGMTILYFKERSR